MLSSESALSRKKNNAGAWSSRASILEICTEARVFSLSFYLPFENSELSQELVRGSTYAN